jgi:8-oxo-dGTP pyrophosphatase MutT (NUDIX family)
MKKKSDSPAYPVRLRTVALIERDGSIVLVFDPVYRGGCWILPGGGAELNETITQAVEREALEETGLTVEAREVCAMREIWEPEKDFPETQAIRKSLEVFFRCQYLSGEIVLNHDTSMKQDRIARVKDCRWFPVNEISDTIEGHPIYPLEFFHQYRSHQLLKIPWQQAFLPPLDIR